MNKVYLAFAGREHHAQKLYNVYQALTVLPDTVVHWTIANNSINIDPSSTFISKYARTPTIHLYDDVDKKSIAAINSGIKKANKVMLTKALFERIPPFWAANGIRDAVEAYELFNRMLDKVKPTGILILHANNFWTRAMASRARQKKIPVYAFQEGMLRDVDQREFNKQKSAGDFVDTMFLWTQNQKEKYKQAGVKSNLVTVGAPHLDEAFRALPVRTQRRIDARNDMGVSETQKILLLALPLLENYVGNFQEDLRQLCEYCYINNHVLAVRLHPFNYALYNKIEKIIEKYSPAAIMSEKNSILYYEIMMANVVLGQHSTVALETAMLDGVYYEITREDNDIIESKQFANKLNPVNYSSIDTTLAFENGEKQQKYIDEFRKTNQKFFDGYAADRIAEYIESHSK